MRDIELSPIPSAIPDPAVDDIAYAEPPPGGIASDTAMTDPSYGDTKAYTKPSLGGEFGPANAALLGAPADGGEALLAAAAVVTVTPPVVPTAPIVWPGRSMNNTSVRNLYPWRFGLPLDQNNPNPPVEVDDPPPPPPAPTGVTVTGNTLVGNTGNVAFSGPAARHATVTLDYALDGGSMQHVTIAILVGDTGSQIAAKVRAAIDAVFGLDATGTGGTVNVIGLGGTLTYFHISVS